ncbi:MAG: DUF3732 domain-containing protein [Hyphomicrobiaceae bacterium]|nr:DUF3732 domain-containing protein [Hyphomicrobiaceae bacterium]
MKLKIHRLIVWPQDVRQAPRVIAFNVEKVGVITGWSATGKSAIVAIIDYVLGSGTCAIPVGKIRDLAAWYGLVIETAEGTMMVAREKPASRQVASDYWVAANYELATALPARPVANEKVDKFKSRMDRLAGLSDLRLSPDETDGFSERASFRDMAAFNFLPQHIVANPYTMFFKADSSDHKRKLSNVLPLALGIVTNDDLLRLHRMSLLQRQAREIEQRLRARRAGVETWRANLQGAFYRAQELNLLPAGGAPTDLDRIVDLLRTMVTAGGRSLPGVGRVEGAVARLEEVRRQEKEVDGKISSARRRLRKLRSLRASVDDYDAILAEQTARTHGVGWLKDAVGKDHCVLCGTDTEVARRALAALDQPLRELQELTAGTVEAAPVVDAEIVNIEAQLITDERRLLELRELRIGIEAEADEERGLARTLESVYRFIGNTEQALRMMGNLEGADGLEGQLRALQEQIAALRLELDVEGQKSKRDGIQALIAGYILKFIETLGIVGAGGTPELDERELNLKFVQAGQRRADFLWEIGSGENWMGYHLATLLALHGTFLRRKKASPVPTFLVIDQPSQVYFPGETFDDIAKSTGGETVGVDERARRKKLDDLGRTKQIFAAIARAHRSFNGEVQIIVLEHADQTAWGEEANVALVENWRGDTDYLIPRSWGN